MGVTKETDLYEPLRLLQYFVRSTRLRHIDLRTSRSASSAALAVVLGKGLWTQLNPTVPASWPALSVAGARVAHRTPFPPPPLPSTPREPKRSWQRCGVR